MYDYVIASDEAVKTSLPQKNKKGKRKRYDGEYGVSRGVDFKGVKNVLNFDFPASPHAYVHRVGRYVLPPPPPPSCTLLCYAASNPPFPSALPTVQQVAYKLDGSAFSLSGGSFRAAGALPSHFSQDVVPALWAAQ